jgi:hypothetical protein
MVQQLPEGGTRCQCRQVDALGLAAEVSGKSIKDRSFSKEQRQQQMPTPVG